MLVRSNGSFPSSIRKNPAACSNTFGPILGIFLICVRDSIFPFSSRYDTILVALALFNPATFLSKETLAVLIFTPTRLTAFSTTKSKRSFNLAVGKSC